MIGKLFVKIIAVPGVPGGKAMALVDENGDIVGAQTSSEVRCEVNDIATITVTFYVDGKSIAFWDDKA